MQTRDIRDSAAWRAAEEHFARLLEPAFGAPTGAQDVALHPDGERVAFTATVFEKLEGPGAGRVALAENGRVRLLTRGPGDDALPRWSPDGSVLAFLSDRAERGVAQLHLLRADVGEATPGPTVDGAVEYLHWSPDGSAILLGVAERGADMAGGQGSGTMGGVTAELPAWMPTVDVAEGEGWRSAWIVDVAAGSVRRASPEGLNVWEAVWCGPGALLAVCTDGEPGEAAWYHADLRVIDLATGEATVGLTTAVQLGWPAASPSGLQRAVVQAVCSDRWVVAGDLLLLGEDGADPTVVDTLGVDVTQLVWLDEDRLAYVGQRGLDCVLGVYDRTAGKATETWSTPESIGFIYPEASFLPDGRCAVELDSWDRPPAIAIVTDEARVVASLGHAGSDAQRAALGPVEPLSWRAADGLEIQGLLVTPRGEGPFPLVVHVHGGPVWAFRNRWGMGMQLAALLVAQGYAVLSPNPRGSSGRGQDFTAMVVGDMGGADAHDILGGVDVLVERGVADPARLGLTGGSYGGFMSAWLVTQDPRFAASVPIAPVTDWFSQHHTSNIGFWDGEFLDAASPRH